MNDIKAIETKFDGRRFRSRTEARWAVVFKGLGLAYDYEREGLVLNGEPYLPDFYLPDFPFWFEVKGQEPNERETRLASELSRHGTRVLLAVGPPEILRPQILVWRDGKILDGRYMLLEDRRNKGEFWLVTDGEENGGGGFSIGPADGPPHDRYPIAGDDLKRAFRAAHSERFDAKSE
jgi:hypothetical protein